MSIRYTAALVLMLLSANQTALPAEPEVLARITNCTGQIRMPYNDTGPALTGGAGCISLRHGRYNRCCLTVEVQKVQADNVLNLTEFWTGEGCWCICLYSINATVSNLPPGNYTVTVYSTGIRPDTKQVAEPVLLHQQEVRVHNQRKPSEASEDTSLRADPHR